jgi:hypothetical protein
MDFHHLVKGASRQGFHDFVKSAYPEHVAGSVVELALRVLTRAALSCNAFNKPSKNIPDSSGVKPGMTKLLPFAGRINKCGDAENQGSQRSGWAQYWALSQSGTGL